VASKQILWALIKVTFLGFLVYFCLQFFVPRWESLQFSNRLSTLSGPWILAAAGFTVAYCISGLLIWTTVLRILNSRPDPSIATRAYVYSLLAKYIPGSVVAHGVRTQLAMRAGVPFSVLMKSFFLETIFALGSAAIIAIPGTMYFAPAALERLSSWVVALVAIIFIAVKAARRFDLPRISGFGLTALPCPKDCVNISFLYLLIWLLSAGAHWCLANALSDYSISYFPLLLVAVSASWVIGFVSVFAPAGLGVREAVLYSFVNESMDQADVILFVTLSRLVVFGIEVLLTAGFLLYSKVAHKVKTVITQ
jgi:hypothetical protein